MTPNQAFKFETKNWFELNDGSLGTYKTNSKIKFSTWMLKSSLCDYSDTYVLVEGTIAVPNTVAATADANNVEKNTV